MENQNKKRIHVGYVILHYINIEDTIRCVSSIEKTTGIKNNVIVIVDNASPNNSGKLLIENYKDVEEIYVIVNNNNDGFSEGNNIGYRFIRANYDPDFVIICNNDIEFPEIDFIEKIEKIYSELPFYVLGPDIYNPLMDTHQNPLDYKSPSVGKALSTYIKNSVAGFLFPLYWDLIGRKYVKNMEQGRNFVFDYRKPMSNVPLMGACLIFSKDFLHIRKNVFEPDTFLYYEEYLLFNYCMSNDFLMVYCPEIQVFHYDGGATKSSIPETRQRHQRYINNIKHASGIYLKTLINKKKKGKYTG